MTPATAAIGLGQLFNPANFVEGGLIDDIDGKITDAKTLMYDYNGKQPDNPVPALAIEITMEDGTKHESYYSAGDAKFWAPNADGSSLVPTADKTSISKSCKLGVFLAELANSGFPMSRFDSGSVRTALVGLVAHFQRKADKERKGLVRNDDRAQTTLVVTKVIALPGEQAKAAPAKTTTGAPAASSAAASAGDLTVDDDVVLAEVVKAVAANGSIPQNRISQLVFKAIDKNSPLLAQRTAIIQRAMASDLLSAGAAMGMFGFDGTTITKV